MKLKKNLLFVFTFLLFSLGNCIFDTMAFAAGGVDGGGGDLFSEDYQAAWFLGQAPIRYCVEQSEDFPVAHDELLTKTQWALDQWKEYYLNRVYKLDQLFPSDPRLQISIDVNFIFISDCSANSDLKFVFGKMNPKIEDLLKHRDNPPQAFSFKEEYDIEKGWGRGFIWIAPHVLNQINASDWNHGNNLQTILLHEIGHIFGNSHSDETIMRENIGNLISEGQYLYHPYGLLIDHQKQLFPDFFNKSLKGYVDVFKDRSLTTFFEMTGHQAQGDVTSELSISPSTNEPFLAKVVLSIKDAKRKYDLPIDISIDCTTTRSGKPFKTALKGQGVAYTDGSAGSYVGTIKTSLGQTKTVLIKYNLDIPTYSDGGNDSNKNYSKVDHGLYLEVFIIENGKEKRLFGPGALLDSSVRTPSLKKLTIK